MPRVLLDTKKQFAVAEALFSSRMQACNAMQTPHALAELLRQQLHVGL
jgi:hypothetical protein